MNRYIPVLGRVLFSLIFIASGFGKIADFGGTQEYMAAYGMPATAVLLVGAIVLEIFGGASVLLGWKTRWGALALLIFLIPATLIFHSDFSQQIEMIQFMKNLALMGGTLIVYSLGPGPVSLDGPRDS
ncbi:MAG: DoxX family protein [Acidobacteriota bacterium]